MDVQQLCKLKVEGSMPFRSTINCHLAQLVVALPLHGRCREFDPLSGNMITVTRYKRVKSFPKKRKR